MLGGERRDGDFEFLALVGRHDEAIGQGRDEQDLDAFLFRDDLKLTESLENGDLDRLYGVRPVPADRRIGEKAGEVEVLEVAGGFLALLGSHGKKGLKRVEKGLSIQQRRVWPPRRRPESHGDSSPLLSFLDIL